MGLTGKSSDEVSGNLSEDTTAQADDTAVDSDVFEITAAEEDEGFSVGANIRNVYTLQ